MNIKQFENLILSELETIVGNIIKKKTFLNISARSRAGAEISDYLEREFVKYTHNHKYFLDSIGNYTGS